MNKVSETRKYAELFISMSNDFLLNKIDVDHYVSTMEMAFKQMQEANVPPSKCLSCNDSGWAPDGDRCFCVRKWD